ncbi:MAG: DUF721 domain-containing protein [Candidatus Cloacimonetes bacterium]|nr:DUF721 domain-containing protein [Candidatus Cloacimonadota bacterium]
MDFTPAGNNLKKIVYSIAGPEQRDFVSIAFGWKKIVGNLLTERSSIKKLENGVLFVSVSNNVWMQELILRKFQIMKDIKSILNVQLSDIVFFMKSETKRKFRKKNG